MWYFSWEGGVLNRLLNLLNPRRLSWLSFRRRLATWRWSLQTSPGEFNNPSITTYLVKSNYHHIFGGIQVSQHIWWNPSITTYLVESNYYQIYLVKSIPLVPCWWLIMLQVVTGKPSRFKTDDFLKTNYVFIICILRSVFDHERTDNKFCNVIPKKFPKQGSQRCLKLFWKFIHYGTRRLPM